MRILLDECIDERLRHLFTEYDCQTARNAGFAGLTNGALLLAGKSAAFDVLMTVDQNIPDQQTLTDLGTHPLWSHQSPVGSEPACPCRSGCARVHEAGQGSIRGEALITNSCKD